MKYGYSTSYAEAVAYKILSQQNELSFPIPLMDIVKAEGIKLMPWNFGEGITSVLVVEDKKAMIGYNEKYPSYLFSIAYSLGHFKLHAAPTDIFIHRGSAFPGLNKASTKEGKQQHEAHAFAASLMMPESAIKAAIESPTFSIMPEEEMLAALAKKFKVSLYQFVYRLTILKYV